jgi:Ca2+-binding EF-hand superfamily protein
VPVQEADFTEAEQTIKRYDRNRNGILEADEIRNARWRDDPMKQDRNGDGKLTRSELAVRYSLRRTSEAQRQAQSSTVGGSGGSQDRGGNSRSSGGSSSGGSSSGGSSRFGGGSSGGSSGADRMAQFAGSMLQRYDTDKSGVIEKSEWKNFRSDPSAADTNKDSKITKDELSKWMTSRFSQGRGGDSSSSRGGSGGRSEGAAAGGSGADYVGSGSYRFKLPQEGLPDGLPGWYVDSDKNSDGQIAMSEYTGKWDAKKLAEYYAYDVNRDGVITPGEALETTKSGYVRGESATRAPAGRSRDGNSGSSESRAAPAAKSGGPDEKYVKFAVSQIAKYDENKNGVLDGGEIAISTQKSSMIKASADANGDGKITPIELATALTKR